MGILSQPLSRGAALFGVVAIGTAISGTFPQKQGLSLQLAQFVHLLSVGMVVGIGNWTTFVFGIVAFKNLPRQTFGQLQAKLFPKYFQVLSISLGLALVTFANMRQIQSKTSNRQIWVLSVALIPNLLNLLVIEPATTSAMNDRHRLEKGVEKDKASQDALKSKSEYKSLSKRFGMLHGLSSLANLITVGAAHVHLWYLAAVMNNM